MLLYRAEQHQTLMLLKALAMEKLAALIQAVARGKLARSFAARLRKAKPALRRVMDGYNASKVGGRGGTAVPEAEELDSCIAEAEAVIGQYAAFFSWFQMKELAEAKRLRFALTEWDKLATEMRTILEQDLSDDDNFDMLFRAVRRADAISDVFVHEYYQQMYEVATKSFHDWRDYRLLPRLDDAMRTLERDDMSAIYAECKRLGLDDPRLKEIEDCMHCSEAQLLKLQYKRATELGDTARRQNKEVKLKELHLKAHGQLCSNWNEYPGFRTPYEFSQAKFLLIFGSREALAAGMLVHSADEIHTSLTVMPPDLVKKARMVHRSILAFTGDRARGDPQIAAAFVVAAGIEAAGKTDSGSDATLLRTEIYAQLLKHATENPVPVSLQRAWDLLLLCLMSFPPAPSFENYLNMWLRINGPSARLAPSMLVGALYRYVGVGENGRRAKRDKETERQREKETERQGSRETRKGRDKERERQGKERQGKGETRKQRNKERQQRLTFTPQPTGRCTWRRESCRPARPRARPSRRTRSTRCSTRSATAARFWTILRSSTRTSREHRYNEMRCGVEASRGGYVGMRRMRLDGCKEQRHCNVDSIVRCDSSCPRGDIFSSSCREPPPRAPTRHGFTFSNVKDTVQPPPMPPKGKRHLAAPSVTKLQGMSSTHATSFAHNLRAQSPHVGRFNHRHRSERSKLQDEVERLRAARDSERGTRAHLEEQVEALRREVRALKMREESESSCRSWPDNETRPESRAEEREGPPYACSARRCNAPNTHTLPADRARKRERNRPPPKGVESKEGGE